MPGPPPHCPRVADSPYVTRHGFGYSVFEHTQDGITSELWLYVSINEPVKFAVIKIKGISPPGDGDASLTGYWEWVLGEQRQKSGMHVTTELIRKPEPCSRAILTIPTSKAEWPPWPASELARSHTADRTEFLRSQWNAHPTGRLRRSRLSGKTGVALDPCAALQVRVGIGSWSGKEISFILGTGQNAEHARDLARRFQNLPACREELQKVWDFWGHTLNAVRVETPPNPH